MEYRTLGKTLLRVPVIGMGTWRTFDVQGDRAYKNAARIIDTALENEVTFFDSSPMYGAAEYVLGRTLEGRRERVQIATKIWTSTRAEAQQQVKRALSLFHNCIDLYQIHNLVNWREHLPLLEGLRDAGQVRTIGITHYSSSAFREMRQIMQTGRIDAIQIPYNPFERDVEKEILPLAQEMQIGVVVMRPFAEGALMRRQPAAEDLEPFAGFGVQTWAQVLLKWILSDPRCHVTIPATSHYQRMSENAAAGNPPWFGAEERERVVQLSEARR
ncbi:MAG TPA: aldo/keto reductase [Ktedonobacteraceae bacterium]|nr:aldo/keto reductase [Ktedonobacteraceae bacterium]